MTVHETEMTFHEIKMTFHETETVIPTGGCHRTKRVFGNRCPMPDAPVGNEYLPAGNTADRHPFKRDGRTRSR